MELDFYKLHLNSHDFILVNGFSQPLGEEKNFPKVSAYMCNRFRGIGARGVLFLFPGDEHQGRVLYYDREGEERRIPADALLCCARYAFDFGLADRGTTVLENWGGAYSVQCIDGVHFRYSLEEPKTTEGKLILSEEDADLTVRIRVGSRSLSCTPVKFQNIVVAIYDEGGQLSEAGAIEGLEEELDIGKEQYRPVGYQVFTRDELSLFFRSREEGDAVEGAAAAATASVLGGFCDRDVVVHYRGGKFLYEWQSPGNRVFITGTPEYSFTGTFELDDQELFADY